MKSNTRRKKWIAWVLAAGLMASVLGPIGGAGVLAQGASPEPSQSAEPSALPSQSAEPTIAPAQSAEPSQIAQPSASAEPTAQPTPPPDGAADAAIQRVTGFVDGAPQPITLTEKPAEADLPLPETLEVYLDGADTPSAIPVRWVCQQDYDGEGNEYSFSPVWDEARYPLDEALAQAGLPLLTVRIAPAANVLSLGAVDIHVEGTNVTKNGGIQQAVTDALADYSAEQPAGDVTLYLKPDKVGSDYTQRNILNSSLTPVTVLDLPTDKGITSFTITTDHPDADAEHPVMLWVAGGSAAYFFANGIPLTVTGPINLGGNLYGGGHGVDIAGDTRITYAGATLGHNSLSIYGGGLNGSVDGSTHVVIQSSNADFNNGVSFAVSGGGYADSTGSAANVTGSTRIDLYALAVYVQGGGTASSGATANVGGDATIQVHSGGGIMKMVYGGGNARNYGDGVSNANVAGTCSILLNTAVGQHSFQYDGNYIVGGGVARLDGSGRAIANVGGVYIQADGDVSTNTKPNTDRCILGGGDMDGPSGDNPNTPGQPDRLQANVLGDVTIRIGAGASLSKPVIGGGSPNGGSAAVLGSVRIQVGDNARLSGLIGGGTIDSSIKHADNADVGGVSVTLGDGVTCQGDFIAGGYAQFGGSNPAGSHADVLGDVRTQIGGGFSLNGQFIGGGATKLADTRAQVTGNIQTQIGQNAQITGQFIGGGSANNQGAEAQVAGHIETTLGGDFSCSYFTAAGRASGVNSIATVGSPAAPADLDDRPATVSTTFTGGSSASMTASNDFFLGAGRAYAEGCDATVYGDTVLRFDGVAPNRNVYGGGLSLSGSASVTGSASVILQDVSVSRYIYGGGYASEGQTASVGSASVRLLGDTELTGGIWQATGDVGEMTVFVGDGQTPTDASLNLIYERRPSLVVTAGAALTHKLDASENKLLWNAQDVRLEPGGSLNLVKSEALAGDFVGGGALTLKAGTNLTIGGQVSGNTRVHIDGEPQLGEVYIRASDKGQESADVFYMENGLKLVQENGVAVWKIDGMIPPTITTAALPDGRAQAPYTHTLTADGDGDMHWSLTQGSLPDGLTLDEDTGVISGTPTAPGVHTFTVTASNGAAPDDSAQLTLTIDPAAYAVSLTVRRDGAPWPDHGRTLTLRAADQTLIEDLSAVAPGVYRVLADGADTGVTVTVDQEPAQAALDYYTVRFAAVDAGSAQGSAVSARSNGAPIRSGEAVLKGSALALSCQGAGAQDYAYRWNTGAQGAELTLPSVDGPVDLVCTVTGAGLPPTPSGDPDPSGSPEPSGSPDPSGQPSPSLVPPSASPTPSGQPATGDPGLPWWPFVTLALALAALICLLAVRKRRA